VAASSHPTIWDFYVGEEHDTHTVLWHFIQVRKQIGELFVMEPVDGQYVPLEGFRRGQSRQALNLRGGEL